MAGKVTQLFKDSVIYGLGQAATQLVNFVLVPLYVRVLTQQQYGAVSMLIAAQAILAAVSAFGIDAAMFRSYYENDDPRRRSQVVTTALALSFAIGAMIAGLAFFSAPAVAPMVLGPGFASVVLAYAISAVAARNPGLIGFAVLRAQGRTVTYAVLSVLSVVIRLALIITFVSFLNQGVTGFAIGSLVAEAIVSVLVFASVGTSLSAGMSRGITSELVSFGAPLALANLMALVLMSFDRFILRPTHGLVAVAIYSLGYQLGNVIGILVVVPLQLVWPTVALPAAEEPDAQSFYARSFTYTLFLGMAASVLVTAFGPAVIQIVAPPSYRAAAMVVPLVAIANLMVILQRMLAIGLELKRKMVRYAGWFAIAASLNVGLNLLLIPRFGMMAAAWTTFISYAVLPVMAYFMSRRVYEVRYQWAALARICIATLTALALWLVFMNVGSNVWVTGVLTTATFALLCELLGVHITSEVAGIIASFGVRGRVAEAEDAS